MNQRYTKLFALSENLYTPGAPVIISSGALHKDNVTGSIIAQLKFLNIDPRTIKALKLMICPLDTVGNPIGGEFEYQYLDLNEMRDSFFGQNTAIQMENPYTRGFKASVKEVIFTNNSIWQIDESDWQPLKKPTTLMNVLRDHELVKQFKITYGSLMECFPEFSNDSIWQCGCGAINRADEGSCHKCRILRENLRLFDLNELKSKCDERLKKETEYREKERIEEEKRKKKLISSVITGTPILIAIIIGINFLSNYSEKSDSYKAAIKLYEAENYDEAIEIFENLNGFKDSEEMIFSGKIEIANKFIKKGKYDDAYQLIKQLKSDEDSNKQTIYDTKFKIANELIKDEKFAKASSILKEIGADDEYIKSITYDAQLGNAIEIIKTTGNWNNAFRIFKELFKTEYASKFLTDDEINKNIINEWIIYSTGETTYQEAEFYEKGEGIALTKKYNINKIMPLSWKVSENHLYFDIYYTNGKPNLSTAYNMRNVTNGLYLLYKENKNEIPYALIDPESEIGLSLVENLADA